MKNSKSMMSANVMKSVISEVIPEEPGEKGSSQGRSTMEQRITTHSKDSSSGQYKLGEVHET